MTQALIRKVSVQYHPCDLCGSLVESAYPPGPHESIICEGCLQARLVKAVPIGTSDDELDEPKPRYKKHIHKFRCLHCGRKLRSKPVKRPVHLECPACSGRLLLLPGGEVTMDSEWQSGSGDLLVEARARPHESIDPSE